MMRLFTPRSLAEALALKARRPEAIWLAGGTDLLAQWSGGAAKPDAVIAIGGVPELRGIVRQGDGLRLGALTSAAEIAASPDVARHFPALAEAAASLGAPTIRGMATLGGNLANASPAADLPPALLVYDAEVELRSSRGERRLPLGEFFTAYRTTALAPGEALAGVRLSVPSRSAKSGFVKLGARRAQAIAKISLAARLELERGNVRVARLAAGSVAAIPVRLRALEEWLTGRALTARVVEEASALAPAAVSPIDDIRSTAEYRAHALGALTAKLLNRFAGRK